MVPKLLKAETSRHPWLLFFLLIPYHEVLHFIWKCTLSLSFSHFSISCLCFCPSHHQMISPQPILKRSELVPFSIFYILVSDLLKIWATFISLPLLKSFRGFLLQSEHSALGSIRLCMGQSPWLPPRRAVQPPSPFGSLNMSNSPCPRTFALTDFSIWAVLLPDVCEASFSSVVFQLKYYLLQTSPIMPV